MTREWLYYREKPPRYYQKSPSPCVIIGSVCFEPSLNLWFGHIYTVSTFCLNTSFQCNSSERVNFKWKNTFRPLNLKRFFVQNPKHICLSLQQSRGQNSVGKQIGEREELLRAGLFDEKLMCHQIEDSLFV